MTNSFKLSELSENTLVGRDIGKKIRNKILTLLETSEKLIIDMENSTSISPSFLDETIVILVCELGKEQFNKRIELQNINIGIKSLMNSMLRDRLNREG